MYRIAINFDEISDDFDQALQVMRDCDIWNGELRTLDGKSFVNWSDNEVDAFKARVERAGIILVAAATPLFKWYSSALDKDIVHDSFGFDPRLTENEKRRTVLRTIEIASRLAIPRLRIFSGLGTTNRAGERFAHDPLLAFALDLANDYGLDLLIENEPVCLIHTQEDLLMLLDAQPHSRLKLWLDIANLIEIGEVIGETFVQGVASRLDYIHVKDFIVVNEKLRYVPLGDGLIDYAPILTMVNQETNNADLVVSVETHAKTDKVGASRKSLQVLKEVVSALNSQ